MVELIRKFGEKLSSVFPDAQLLMPEFDGLSEEGDLVVSVINVADEDRFFELVMDFQDEFLTPRGIHNIVFIPHSVEDTRKYFSHAISASAFPAT